MPKPPATNVWDVVIVCSRQCYALSVQTVMPSTLSHRPQLRSAPHHGASALTWSPPHHSALPWQLLSPHWHGDIWSIMTMVLSMSLSKARHYIRNIWGPTQRYMRVFVQKFINHISFLLTVRLRTCSASKHVFKCPADFFQSWFCLKVHFWLD